MTQCRVTHTGGPTTLLEIDGWRDDVPRPKLWERPLRSSLSSVEWDAVQVDRRGRGAVAAPERAREDHVYIDVLVDDIWAPTSSKPGQQSAVAR